uniref:Uncharacterized protein n=1 Tax=Arundo donax TaxID=35708 RepID=A0A0A9D061_ARUDO
MFLNAYSYKIDHCLVKLTLGPTDNYVGNFKNVASLGLSVPVDELKAYKY